MNRESEELASSAWLSNGDAFSDITPVKQQLPTHPFVAFLICGFVLAVSLVAGIHQSAIGLMAVAIICSAVLIFLLKLSVFDLIIITIPTSIYVSSDSSQINTSVSDLVILFALVQLLVSDALQQAWRLARRKIAPVVVAAIAMVVSMTLPVLFWPQPEFNFRYYILDTFKLSIVIVYFVVVVIYCVRALRGRDYRFVYVWVAVAVVESALGVGGSLLASAGSSNVFSFSTRAVGTFSDPNSYAAYLLASVCMVWFAYRILDRKLVLICAAPMVVGILLSGSRAGFISLLLTIVGLGLMTAAVSEYRRALIVMLGVGCVSAYVTLILLSDNTTVERSASSFEDDSRWLLVQAAVQMWLDSPIVGVGMGQFRSYAGDYLAGSGHVLVHNTYLSFLAEGGLVALLLFVFILVFVVVALLRVHDSGKYPLILGIVAMGVMAGTLNLQNFRPLWVFLAVALGWSVWRQSQVQAMEDRTSSDPA